MAPPKKQENLLSMEDCRLLLKNAVDIKLMASANFKLTAIDALVIAGFEQEVANNPAMISHDQPLLPTPPQVKAEGSSRRRTSRPSCLASFGPATQGPTSAKSHAAATSVCAGWALDQFPPSPIICKATPSSHGDTFPVECASVPE
jgi:hypothetical protein